MQGLLLTLRKLGAQITFHGEEGHFPFTLETMGLPEVSGTSMHPKAAKSFRHF